MLFVVAKNEMMPYVANSYMLPVNAVFVAKNEMMPYVANSYMLPVNAVCFS
jgi:hypothetical protein